MGQFSFGVDNLRSLIEIAYGYLREKRIEPFSFDKLRRSCIKALQEFEMNLFQKIASQLNTEQKNSLNNLLCSKRNSEVYLYNLREAAGATNLESVLSETKKLKRIQEIYLSSFLFESMTFPVLKKYAQKLSSETTSSIRALTQDKRYALRNHALSPKQETAQKEFSQESVSVTHPTWQNFTEEEKHLCKAYFQKAEAASELNTLVQAECAEKGQDPKTTSHYHSWQTACGERNKAAYGLTPLLAKEETRQCFQKGSLYYIESHAKKYETFLEKREHAGNKRDLYEELKSNIDPLLTKLFPDGATFKTATQYRFGAKGSLSVTHSGDKLGQFYDFETGQGGGLLKLIQKELHLSSKEAWDWASAFLGNSSSMHVSPLLSRPQKAASQESHWISLKAPANINGVLSDKETTLL